jgi:hypothetical protein
VIEPGSRIEQSRERSPFTLLLVVVLTVMAAAGAAIFLTKSKGLQQQANAKPQDLGQGVAADHGLRGHLVVEWHNMAAHYKLKMEPLDALAANGFARGVVDIKQPVSVNVRVLDATGAVLCGKQIVLAPGGHSDGVNAFKAVDETDGQAEGLWSEGTLPCSLDQYMRFDYWDFTTDFPTVTDQAGMLGAPARKAEQAGSHAGAGTAQAQAAGPRVAKAKVKKGQSGFYLEGDDHVTAFERGRNVLTVGPGKSFVLARATDAATAATWSDDSSLVHYTCDQRDSCVLRHGGTMIPARRND